MATIELWQILIYLGVLTLLTRPLGAYLYWVFAPDRGHAAPLLPLERPIHRLLGVDAQRSQRWSSYAGAVLTFNLLGFLLLYALLRLQPQLPLNPQQLPGLSPDLAFNVAVSFVTNTNWQSYAGEASLSHFSQMVGLGVQNFASAATGMAVCLVLIRALAAPDKAQLGNFWVDLIRTVLYLLLPLALLLALLLIWQGTPQNLLAHTEAQRLDGGTQLIAQGPVASQLAIKQLGSNGGGFFNANSAHPFENPTALSNLLQALSLLLIASALTHAFGRWVGNPRQGWALYAAMAMLLSASIAVIYLGESEARPLHAEQVAGVGNLEGKETRFSLAESAIWAAATTAASNGSVNAMHDSMQPLSGLATLVNMQLGEVIYGGVGAGLYGMLLFVVLTVFIAGLMVGRTPEYLGRKIEAREVKLAMLGVLIAPLCILGFTALACVVPAARDAVQDAGPHGFSEILYAYTSAAANNGSAFAGLSANNRWYNTTLGIAMLLGRYGIILPVLAIAGALASKVRAAPSAGSFPTDSPSFVVLLVAVILIVGGLSFFPTLALGPIVEHLALRQGSLY